MSSDRPESPLPNETGPAPPPPPVADHRSKRAARTGALRFLLLESLVVVISVLVALAVDGYREEVGRAERVQEARSQILAEVGANLDELQTSDSIISYRLGRLQELEPVAARGDRPFADIRFGGFWIPELRTAVWERVRGGELGARLPAEFMNEAFGLYGVNDELDTLDEEVRDLTFSGLNHRPGEAEVAWAVAESIMRQQLAWIGLSIGLHRDFLDRFAVPAAGDADR